MMTPSKPHAESTGLHVTLTRDALGKLVAECLPFVERKTPIPILANFLLKAEVSTLTLQATDLDSSISRELDCQVKHEGQVTVPARKLSDTLKKLGDLPDTMVTLQADAETTLSGAPWITLTCGEFKVKLPGMKAANWPVIQKLPELVATSIPAEVLAGLITRTRYAMAETESRYTLNGALLIADTSRVTMVATDGHRLAKVTHPTTFAGPGVKVLIRRQAIDLLYPLLGKRPDGREITVRTLDRSVYFTGRDWTMVTRALEGQFPNYDTVLPKSGVHTNVLTVADSKSLAAAVTRVAQFADERSRAMGWQVGPADELRLTASSSETGEASQTVKCMYAGRPITIRFKSDYVLDFLKTVNGGGAVVRLRDEMSCGEFIPLDGGEYTVHTVIMPLRM